MSDSFVQLNNDGPGKKIDTRTENTNGDHRQVMVIGDPATNANVANVTAAGAVQVDGSGVTQPVSGTFFQATQPISGTVQISVPTQAPVLKTGSLITTATTVDQVVLTYTVTSGKTFYVNYIMLDGNITAGANNLHVILGTISLE